MSQPRRRHPRVLLYGIAFIFCNNTDVCRISITDIIWRTARYIHNTYRSQVISVSSKKGKFKLSKGKMHRRSSGGHKFRKAVIVGTLSGLLTSAALLLICSFILLKAGIMPTGFSGIISIVCLCAGGIISGITASKIYPEKALPTSLFISVILFMIILGISLSSGAGITLTTLLRFLLLLSCGAVPALSKRGAVPARSIRSAVPARSIRALK